MSVNFFVTRRLITVGPMVCLLCLFGGSLLVEFSQAEIPTNFTSDTLARFDFEGVTLATTPEQLKRLFPQLAPEDQKSEEAIKVACYKVNDLKTADAACFYFVDNTLYQLEIDYKPARIASLGGMAMYLKNLVRMFGYPDHADSKRRTWQQPTIGRRADFYSSPEGYKLLVTDTNLTGIVTQRSQRAVSVDPIDFGF